MNKEELLEKIRIDRPSDIIHEVLSYKENKYGFYDVKVNKVTMFFETKVLNSSVTLPYPYSEYNKLSEKEQFQWRFENLNGHFYYENIIK